MPIAYPYRFSDWYGYDKDCSSVTSFASGTGQQDFKFICSQTVNSTKYHDGSGTFPAAGDTVYNNISGGSGSQATANGFYTYSNGGTSAIAQYRITGGSGVVASVGICFP